MDYNIKDVCVNLDEQLRNSVSTIDNFFRSPEFSAITEGVVTDKWSCSLVDGSVVVDFGTIGRASFTPTSSSSQSSNGVLKFDTVKNFKGATNSLSLSNSAPDVRSNTVVTRSIVFFFGGTFKDVLIDILSSYSLKSLPSENIKSAYNRIVTSNIIKSIKGVVSPADLVSYFSCYSIALKVIRVASWLEDFIRNNPNGKRVTKSLTSVLKNPDGVYLAKISLFDTSKQSVGEVGFKYNSSSKNFSAAVQLHESLGIPYSTTLQDSSLVFTVLEKLEQDLGVPEQTRVSSAARKVPEDDKPTIRPLEQRSYDSFMGWVGSLQSELAPGYYRTIVQPRVYSENLTKLSVMFTFVDGTECLGIVERSTTTQLLSYRGTYRSPVSVLEDPSFKTQEEVFNWIKKVAKTKGCVVKKR